VGSGRDSPRIRRERPAGDRVQVGIRPSDRGGRDHRGRARLGQPARRPDTRRRHLCRGRPRLRRRAGLCRSAVAAERRGAGALPRLRRNQRGPAAARRELTCGMAQVPAATPDVATRCGIDTVEIARVERLLGATAPSELQRLFSPQELADSGAGAGRVASLAARFAAKEACVKLFPREAALGAIEPADFSVARDAYGAPRAVCNEKAEAVLAKNRIRSIALSLTHNSLSATAVALA